VIGRVAEAIGISEHIGASVHRDARDTTCDGGGGKVTVMGLFTLEEEKQQASPA